MGFLNRLFGAGGRDDGGGLSPRDLSLAEQALKEALTCLGYAMNDTLDNPNQAIEVGVAQFSRGEGDLATIAIAAGIANRYAESNRLSARSSSALAVHIISRFAEYSTKPVAELAEELQQALATNPTIGFLAEKAHKDTWTMAAQFRTSSVLRGMIFGNAP